MLFDDRRRAESFGAVTYDTASWIEHLGTHSDHQTLRAERRERLYAAVADAIDALGGSFEMGYDTVLVSARRSPARP